MVGNSLCLRVEQESQFIIKRTFLFFYIPLFLLKIDHPENSGLIIDFYYVKVCKIL